MGIHAVVPQSRQMTTNAPITLTWRHCLPVSLAFHAVVLSSLYLISQNIQPLQPIPQTFTEPVSLSEDFLPPVFIEDTVTQDIPDPAFDPFEQPDLPDIRPTNILLPETHSDPDPQPNRDINNSPEPEQSPVPANPIPAQTTARAVQEPSHTEKTPEPPSLAQGTQSSAQSGSISAPSAPHAEISGNSGNANTHGSNTHVSDTHAQGTGTPQASPPSLDEEALWKAYAVRLNAHFRKFKHYPMLAKKRRLTGTVLIRITLERSGNVLDATILKSSGSAILDDAALASAREASPAPAFPNALNAQTKILEIPYSYSLK